MSYFVVAGMPECCMFNHVRVISDILSDHLPNFTVNIIQLEPPEWKKWIKEKNINNGWYHLSSPIVWKEFTLRGGKAHLIGGASEFWEYCYDYYNLESLLPKAELYKIVADFKQYNDARKIKEAKEQAKKQKLIICISSNKNKGGILLVVIMRLLERVKSFAPVEVIIRILEEDNVIDDVTEMLVFQAKFEFVVDLERGLNNADLLIIIGDYTREAEEDLVNWLSRNKSAMEKIASVINQAAKNSLRVIVGVNGPVCFNAAILLDTVTKIHLHNIVAETSSVGLEPLSLVSKITKMDLKDLSSPPIWGFIGLNQIIDLEHIVQRFDVYRPNVRAVKNNYNSTLQLGKNHTELRYLGYMSDKFRSVWVKLKKKQDSSEYLYQINRLAKARGIMTIIDNWYFPNENIISIGLLTNGSFGIPSGIVFSQPVMFKNGRWTPMQQFPIPRRDPCGIEDLLPFIKDIYKLFKIRRDIFIDSN